MGTVVEFRLLVLDSLKYSSTTVSPINRSTKAVISRNLTTSLFIYLLIYYFFFLSFLDFFVLFLIYLQKTSITVYILMFKSKKLASYLSVFSLPSCNSSGLILESLPSNSPPSFIELKSSINLKILQSFLALIS